jgi:diaminopimelate epimerase
VVEKKERSNFATKICSEIPGFNSDGLIFLDSTKDSSFDFQWDFYNSDGSAAEMCGNAARCVTLYFFKKVEQKKQIHFKTLAGNLSGEVLDETKFDESNAQVKIKMPKVISAEATPKQLNVKVGDKNIRGCLVDTGVPHFVIESEPNEGLARALRKVKDFGPRGANITFIEMNPDGVIQAVTFERGVEDFTLACGTGAVAAAKYHHLCYPEFSELTVEMPGGELQVILDEPTHLIGEARLEFDLDLYKGVFD